MTMCCYSTMLVDHPFYQNNVVMVMADAVRMDVPKIEICATIYLKDVPQAKLQLLDPFKGVVIDKDNLDDEGKAEREKMQNLFSVQVVKSSGTSTGQEIEENGVNILGLEEYNELM